MAPNMGEGVDRTYYERGNREAEKKKHLHQNETNIVADSPGFSPTDAVTK